MARHRRRLCKNESGTHLGLADVKPVRAIFGQIRWESVCRRSRLVAGICLLAALFASSIVWADTFDVVTKLQDTSATTVWRIDEPNVKQKSTSYTQIRFVPGDVVNIDAGGCVQTGGSGRTWKRYVNPSGPNADRLYHGLIWIPGINGGLERIQNFGLNKNYQIKSPLPGINPVELYLRLGYEDDGYSDNGYYSHDDGTEDQCKNVDHAWAIISIGHDGALPQNAGNFVGITPNHFRCQAAWAFANFDTPELNWSTFTKAFSFGILDYADPATYITFYAGRGIASGGNCEGMSLLADVGEDQFAVGDLKESFWSNYKSLAVTTPAVSTDINISHWKQLSAYFLRNWLGTVLNSPATNAAAIERDLTKADYNYGLLSIENGTEGHVLVPISVSHSGQQTLIAVYDPNRPCGSIPDEASYPSIVIEGDKWSYLMAGGDTWSDSGYGLAYIPYVGEDGWSDLGTNISGILKIIFGNGVSVDQVTDSTGKKLYVANRPGVLDRSPQGLGKSLVRIPKFAAGNQKRPRSSGSRFSLNHALKLTPGMASRSQDLQKEYEADYADSGQIYLATNAQLNDLTFSLSGTNPAKPVRVLIGNKDEFVEMKVAPETSSLIHPSLVLHNTGRLAAGATVQDRNGASLKVTVSHGSLSATANNITVEKTDEIAAATVPLKVQLTESKELQVVSSSVAAQANVNTQVIDVHGVVKTAPIRRLPIQKP
jgi:hypothetical protein